MEYRKDIDGLRAVAVLPALFFHAGFSGFAGGYVGIEIFFVVSGYLITNIILSEQSKQRFSLADFYERRARRILPALSVVLLVTSIFAFLLMPAYLLKWYSQSLVYVSTFASNIYFFYTTGYFSPAAGEKPLLHMWSLAVEEQYYFIYPIFILLFTKYAKKYLSISVFLVALASLIFAHTLALLGEDQANYYHTFSRTWELLFGAVIAFWSIDKKYAYPRYLREIMCALGFLMIAYAVVFFDQYTLYPSLLTLVPVLGTCFIIVFGHSTIGVSRALSFRPVVLIGLMSYSIYLWHHPIYAFLRLKTVGDPSFESFVIAVFLSIFLGYLTWRFVETPFRNKKKFSRKQIFSYAFLSITFFCSIGLAGHYTKGFKDRYSYQDYDETITYSSKRSKCHTRGAHYLSPKDACEYFGENIEWAVMGDSHSVEIAYQLAEKLKEKNIGIKHLSHSDCPPSLYFEVRNPGCTAWFLEALNYLENNKTIKYVFLTYRHSKFLFGEHPYTYPDLPNVDPNTYFKRSSQVESAEQARELYWKSFKDTIARLQKSGKIVYVLYPIPEIPVEFRKAVMPFSIFSTGTMIDLEKSTELSYYYKRQDYILNKLNSLHYDEQLIAVNPLSIFCGVEYCSAIKDEKALYIDDDHPSLYAAKLIVDSMELK